MMLNRSNLNALARVFGYMPSPAFLIDRDFTCIALNQKFADLMQQSVESLLERTYSAFPVRMPGEWEERLNACTKDLSQQEFNLSLQTSERLRQFCCTIKPVWEDDGHMSGMLTTLEVKYSGLQEGISESHFKRFMNIFPGLCWITDNQNVLRYANKSFFETLHLSNEVIGRRHEEIFGSDLGKSAHINNMDVLKTGQCKEFFQTVRDLNGHPQHFKSYKFPISDSEGRLSLVGTISFDFNSNKQLEDHLYQSDEQFKQAFEHSLIGMALVSPGGTWLRVNQSLCQILGYSEDELQGTSVQSLTHPDDIEKTKGILNQMGVGAEEQIKVEKRYFHKDGSIVWVMLAATMLMDKDGKPLHYVSHFENITKRKEIESSLILSEKKYRTIFENVHDVFYQTDQDGYVTEISPSIKLHSGYTRDEVIGRPVSDFYYYSHDRVRIVEILQSEGSVMDFEVRLKTKDNELRYASVNASLISNAAGKISIEGSMRDVTTRKFQENALKALNTELQESNEQKSKLLSIIGHDLRNPISGSLQLLDITLLDYESSSAEEIHLYLSKMQRELSNANELLEELLTWAKAQFNAFNFNPVFTSDLNLLVRKCVNRILPMAINKGVQLNIDVQEEGGITADVGMLETIIRNLVSNAIKFTRKEGLITVSATHVNSTISFKVSDSGMGMTSEVIEKLFEKNVNYSTYGTSGEKGTGLGLRICHDFVSKHGGEIWVESIVGQGSIFYFTIPQPV